MTITLTPEGAMTEQPEVAGYLLSDLRREAGLTQEVVADRMGVHKRRVGQIEAAYPNVRFDTLTKYMDALGGTIRFVVGKMDARHDRIITDPDLEATREWMTSARRRGIQKMRGSAEELVLQGEQPEPGGDDTGGQVDHADAQSDQGDGGQRE